eukprot:TRINITY_DN6490_c0_g1_i1.p1 TRINITY_DN6490_c0_g1~~TRINITY_DN6490_c0_g1_i1.p1  ORF type:complete len:787 (-),score=254.11 TRINITY_DN6490_c0_g1_i1:26-2386(-)
MVSYVTSIVSLVFLFILIPIFNYMRKRHRNIYLPKIYTHLDNTVPRDPRGSWEWIKIVLTLSEEQLLHSAGVDAAMYLKSLKFCVVLLATMSFFCLIVLVPLNRYSGIGSPSTVKNTTVELSGFDKFTMANVPNGSRLMWFHLISVFLFSGLAYYCANWLYQSLNSIQVENSQYKYDTIVNRTVMINKIPREYQSEEEFDRVMKDLYGDHVVKTHIVPQVGVLDELVKERNKIFKKWRDASETARENPSMTPKHKTGLLGLSGQEVESISHYQMEMDEMDEMIGKLRKRKHDATNTGFVTFDSVATAVQCSQTLLHRYYMKPKLSPYPKDINWPIFSTSRFELVLRHIVVWSLLVILFIFWSVPVTAITAFANLKELQKYHGADVIVWLANQSDLIRELLEGFLPTIALSVFLVLLPFILKIVITMYKHLLNSQYDRLLMSAMWFFLVVNVFLGSVATGTIMNLRYIESLVDEPLDSLLNISEMLAASLPSQSLRFMNYIAFEGFVGYPLFFLLRIDDLLIAKVKRFFAKTERQRIEADEPAPFDYPIQYAREFFIFTMGITYSTITPFIVPFTALYFALAYVSAKHNFIFVLNPPYKGRRLTQMVLDRILFSIFLYQITMAGMFGIKQFAPGVVSLFLAIYTVVFRWRLKKQYYRSSHYLALLECPKDQVVPLEEELEETTQLYLHPALQKLSTRELAQAASNGSSALPLVMKGSGDRSPDVQQRQSPGEVGIIPPSNYVRRSGGSAQKNHSLVGLEEIPPTTELESDDERMDLVELDSIRHSQA